MARILSNGTGRSIPLLAFLLIALVTLAGPVSATDWPVTTSSDITLVISGVSDGDTITLAPGTYTWHDIIIATKSLTFRANASAGGTAANTILDAQSDGRIFNVTDTSTLAVDSLALKNGAVAGEAGGAIYSMGDVAISSSVITNCTAQSAGAVATMGNLTVTSSTLSGITVSGTSSLGGAIYSYGNTTLVSSTLIGCRGAGWGGGIYAAYWGILKSSEISNCTASSGGAISAGSGGVIMESSVISGCSAQYGGAIGTDGDVTITGSSSITNCSASVKGGAINAGGLVTVISSSITDCSTDGDGGAIQVYRSGVSVTSSTIANCSAARGGAVYARSSGSSSIRFSRLVNNSHGGNAVNAISAFAATNNWWGTNSPDFTALVNGPVSYDPWLVMDISAEPSSVTPSQASAVRVAITNTSDGTDTAAGGIFVPDGIPVAWSFTGVFGSLQPASGSLADGASTTTFTPLSAGNATVSATVDGQTVSVPVTVTSSGSNSADSSGETGRDTTFVASSPGTAAGGIMTFDVGEPLTAGGADYSYAISTVSIVPSGTLGTTELTVTDAGAAANAPDGRTVAGIVEIEPVAVNPSAVSSGTITFAVSGTWLSEHGLSASDIVLMRFHDGTWAELPTTYSYTSGGAYYFVATTPGFSYFAIASRISTASADTTAPVTETPDISSPSGTTQAVPATSPAPAPVNAVSSITSEPVTTATTAVPAGITDLSGSSPLATASLPVAAIVAIIGAIWYVRLWWIRRQNPALFRKYD